MVDSFHESCLERMDLHDQKIFEGEKLMEWGDVGTTILVDDQMVLVDILIG